MTRPYQSPPWCHPSYPSSGARTPAQPIALALWRASLLCKPSYFFQTHSTHHVTTARKEFSHRARAQPSNSAVATIPLRN